MHTLAFCRVPAEAMGGLHSFSGAPAAPKVRTMTDPSDFVLPLSFGHTPPAGMTCRTVSAAGTVPMHSGAAGLKMAIDQAISPPRNSAMRGTRYGGPCIGPVMPNGRFRMHGSPGIGPRTKEGKARISIRELLSNFCK